MDHCGTFLLIFFGVFFVASAVHQVRPRWWRPISRFDALGLLPQWSFFAPNPGTEDIHVLMRDWHDDNAGPWIPIDFPDRGLSRAIWHPERFERKVLNDLTMGLRQCAAANPGTPAVVLLSAPYLLLLHWILCQPERGQRPTHRQFALVRTHGFPPKRTSNIEFLSHVHAVA